LNRLAVEVSDGSAAFQAVKFSERQETPHDRVVCQCNYLPGLCREPVLGRLSPGENLAEGQKNARAARLGSAARSRPKPPALFLQYYKVRRGESSWRWEAKNENNLMAMRAPDSSWCGFMCPIGIGRQIATPSITGTVSNNPSLAGVLYQYPVSIFKL